MADSLASIGAHTAASPNPVKLHMQATNSLSRCQRELREAIPCYVLAQSLLEHAQEALAALAALETGAAVH